ncbi:MAG: L-fucose:H+ symporter permease [Sphingobacteriales bacterium SCN 48-20]|uniref:L-fucose:H+ symporter permease n=1 Tax=Terrimonas ferruginea TaxID=249 RepID=UPI000869AEB0|nr:L-fucose:H+ symporter permease [Terrimonas ferruginea]MBN8782000.1 L-fucose:H+ symporter permease [Terrimonas ferruginea]ODT90542.1 MAG: L-fucose:H+ symporter permease [Sphingobacteriales bacterium SCN 48-20]OJW45131.1 MAG: L-fucose:H+ symporter permease [Sphingobacteriales bacterium 48-107]
MTLQKAGKTYGFAIVLITSLFFLWGFALNLNPILIPHLKKACRLSDTQSAFIDSASYFAYFLLAIPAGQFMKRFGYKSGILVGLMLFAVGAFLFYPASFIRSYGFFLVASFIIASGLTFLETAANPYITVLGSPDTATQRLNFAQAFNGLAQSIAPKIGGMFILSGVVLTNEQENTMSPAELNAYLDQEAASVQIPYIIIASVVLLVAILIWRTRLPEIKEEEPTGEQSTGSLFKQKNLVWAVIAQFFYVGAQVCMTSFFIRFADRVAGIDEKAAASYLAIALLLFMIGRFVGTFLMKFISPARLLTIYGIMCVLLTTAAVLVTGKAAIYCLFGVELFMSIMFPTIFALGIRGLGSRTKDGSALIIMSIVGGALFPVLMGAVSDATNIQLSYLVPAACFLVVGYFGLRNYNENKVKLTTAH